MQVSGVTNKGLKPRNMKVVAVLGGGLMGSGIATALAWAGYKVLVKEIKQEFLDGGMKRIQANMDSRVKKKGMTPQQRDAAMALVKGTLTYDDFKVCSFTVMPTSMLLAAPVYVRMMLMPFMSV
jgi:enoyl-CoA hydratase/3-hydroxyacyl-CoA dehydrogenase